ncbi:hypothetical protein [Pannonibacter phragmitetus]|uniref:hypothetical protein n=1 Tax=Pannonibacter phragmitetus TaxID=121719 RepID=UPI003D2EC0EC
MDTGAIRPSLTAYAAVTPATRAPEQNEPAAKTELPGSQTVKPSGSSEEQRQLAENGNQQSAANQSGQREIVRKNTLDPESQSYIYVAMDQETGEVIQQVPSETLRKLRAYAKAGDEPGPLQSSGSVQRTA